MSLAVPRPSMLEGWSSKRRRSRPSADWNLKEPYRPVASAIDAHRPVTV
jgi:hypothetical protein